MTDCTRPQTTPFNRDRHLLYAHLAVGPNMNLSVPFESQTDALLASLVLDNPNVPLHIVQSFLGILKNPDFRAAELSFTSAEDVLARVSQYRRDLASARVVPVCKAAVVQSSTMTPTESPKTPSPVLPEDVLEIIASHLFHARRGFASAAQAQEDAATASQGRFVLLTPCARMRDLMSMSLVAREWCAPAQHFLRRSVKAVGSIGLRRVLLSPRASPALRELHVVLPCPALSPSEQPLDDLREVLFLLHVLLKGVPNLKALYLQTSSAALQDDVNQMLSTGLADVFTVLAGMQSLRYLWLTHIPGPVLHAGNANSTCRHLQMIYAVLPRIQALECIWVHNWCEGEKKGMQTVESAVESASLGSLSFRLETNVMSFLSSRNLGSTPLSPLFTFAQSITHLHLFASNLFIQNVQAPSALFIEVTSAPPRLSSLCLAIDCTADLDVALLSTRLLAPAARLSRLMLVLAGPHATLPRLALPQRLRSLHIHIARAAMRASVLCSQRTISSVEQVWCGLDKDLSSILIHLRPDPSVAAASGTANPSQLANVILSLEPTSSMRNEAERGLLEEAEAQWEVEGLPLVPEAMRICAERNIRFECYRAELPAF